MSEINNILYIFEDFFTKENVELVREDIIVRFPTVTVRNETGDSTVIENLFVKVPLTSRGRLKYSTFYMLRTSFTKEQIECGYVHSHVPTLRMNLDDVDTYKTPCLGSGPIRQTIRSLLERYNLDLWRLFCVELSKYVETESLEGGPYIRMSSIGTLNMYGDNAWSIRPLNILQYFRTNTGLIHHTIPLFVKDILNGDVRFPIKYSDHIYKIAMSPYEFTVYFSNLYISWVRKNSGMLGDLGAGEVLEICKAQDGKIYHKSGYSSHINMSDISRKIGTGIINFKGTQYNFEVSGLNDKRQSEEHNLCLLLKDSALSQLHNLLINVINYGSIKGTNTSKSRNFFTPIKQNIKIL